MTIFTVRTIATQGTQPSSALMRSWIAEFLRQPHPLPPDPGAGGTRTSLNLPPESVRDLAEFLHCSSSSALRRLALHALRSSSADDTPHSDSTWTEPEHADQNLMPSKLEDEIVGMFILVFPLLCLAVLLFVIYRKRRRAKEGSGITTISTTQESKLLKTQ